MNSKVLLVAIAPLLLASPSAAAWKPWIVDQGQSANFIGSIAEDSRGGIWFGLFNPLGSGGGAFHFDGLHWSKRLGGSGPSDLPGGGVFGILEDRSRRTWFGTDAGAAILDPETDSLQVFTTASTQGGLAQDYVAGILQDGTGRFWFANSGYGQVGSNVGVSTYDGSSWQTFTVENTGGGLGSVDCPAIVEDREGTIWLATYSGVSRYSGGIWRHDTNASTAGGLVDDQVLAVAVDSSGGVWFGTAKGLSRFEPALDRWTPFTFQAGGLPSSYVEALSVAPNGVLWIGMLSTGQPDGPGGVASFDGLRWNHFTSGNTAGAINSNSVITVTADRRGRIWIGTEGGTISPEGGSAVFDGESWRSYLPGAGVYSDAVRDLAHDTSGDVWMATASGVVCASGPYAGRYAPWTTGNQIGTDIVSASATPSGEVWFGESSRVIDRFRAGFWTVYRPGSPFGPPPGIAREFAADRTGAVWCATVTAGAGRFDPGTDRWEIFDHASTAGGLPSDQLTGVAVDSAGTVWIATADSGLVAYDPTIGSWTRTTKESTAGALPSNSISAIAVDPPGRVVVTTSAVGGQIAIARYEDGRWQRLQPGPDATPLPSGYVTGLSIDPDSRIWISSSVGAIEFDGVAVRRYTKFSTSGALPTDFLNAILPVGREVWMGSDVGAFILTSDSAAPLALFTKLPPALTGSRTQTIALGSGFGDVDGVLLSLRIDGVDAFRDRAVGIHTAEGLTDGIHHLDAEARDSAGNRFRPGLTDSFFVDATPPSPLLSSPPFGEVVRDTVHFLGRTEDERFARYRLMIRPAGIDTWIGADTVAVKMTAAPSTDSFLGGWNSRVAPDGAFDVRLEVEDQLGLQGVSESRFVTDNQAPADSLTSPRPIVAASGGVVYSIDGNATLSIPPHAFGKDVEVRIELVDGALAFQPGSPQSRAYRISWGAADPEKTCLLAIRPEPAAASATLSLFHQKSDSLWAELGGSMDPVTEKWTSAVGDSGSYALFARAGQAGPSEPVRLSARVLSRGAPEGRVGITFRVGRTGSSTVAIYNRAGRLVRTIASGASLPEGSNTLFWDGRGEDGDRVPSGLYLVNVKTPDNQERIPLAVTP